MEKLSAQRGLTPKQLDEMLSKPIIIDVVEEEEKKDIRDLFPPSYIREAEKGKEKKKKEYKEVIDKRLSDFRKYCTEHYKDNIIGYRIKHILEDKFWNVEEFSKKSGVDVSIIYRTINGRIPQIANLSKIVDALDCGIEVFAFKPEDNEYWQMVYDDDFRLAIDLEEAAAEKLNYEVIRDMCIAYLRYSLTYMSHEKDNNREIVMPQEYADLLRKLIYHSFETIDALIEQEREKAKAGKRIRDLEKTINTIKHK